MDSLFRNMMFIFISLALSGCSEQNREYLFGYIEGEYTYIASGIAGTLFTLNVSRGQPVKQGELLFTLDPEPDQAAMQAAESNVEQLEVEMDFAKLESKRYSELFFKNASDKNTMDQKQSDYNSKAKQLESAKEALHQANWSYQQKISYAPVTGSVFDTFYRIGEKVQANQPVLAILAPENIKVLFYIPEKQFSTIKIGQVITFQCDGCKQATKATISYISPEAEYTPPIIYSQDTRNHLVYLVRADMPNDVAVQFHPGQPVDVYLHE